MYFDPLYLLIMVIGLVLGLVTQGYVNSSYRRWSQVPLDSGRSGAEVARAMLDANGLHSVGIERIGGQLTDHFDPTAGVLRLSAGVHDGRSVAAAGVASHEAGHAVQHAAGYAFARFRMALVPAAQLGSQAAWFLIFLGLVLKISGLAWLGVIAFAAAVLFQVVTLPVEFDASRRALVSLEGSGSVSAVQVGGARQVLSAAALTYLAAALVSILQLLYFIGLARRD